MFRDTLNDHLHSFLGYSNVLYYIAFLALQQHACEDRDALATSHSDIKYLSKTT